MYSARLLHIEIVCQCSSQQAFWHLFPSTLYLLIEKSQCDLSTASCQPNLGQLQRNLRNLLFYNLPVIIF